MQEKKGGEGNSQLVDLAKVMVVDEEEEGNDFHAMAQQELQTGEGLLFGSRSLIVAWGHASASEASLAEIPWPGWCGKARISVQELLQTKQLVKRHREQLPRHELYSGALPTYIKKEANDEKRRGAWAVK